MKGLIVVNGYRELTSLDYKVKRVIEEFNKRQVEMDVISSLNLKAFVKDGRIELSLPASYDFCFYMDKDDEMALLLEKKMRLFNSAEAIRVCSNKMTAFLALSGSGIRMPKTIPSPLCYRKEDATEEKKNKFIAHVEEELSFPLICKECHGSLGLQVYLLKNDRELREKYDELLTEEHLYQEFVASSCGKDFRIFTVGGKAAAYIERINDHDFRSNVARGGKGYLVTPPPGFIEAAEKISKILKLDYAGVDLLIGPHNEPILSEVNANAFVSELEEISKINVTGLLADHIIAALKNS
jgi:gamma-F420-2:alpha-L-glutamate ligase